VPAELGKDLVIQRHLIATHRAPIRGIERQDDGLAAEVRQRHLLVRRRVQREVRRPGLGCEDRGLLWKRSGIGRHGSRYLRMDKRYAAVGIYGPSRLRSTAASSAWAAPRGTSRSSIIANADTRSSATRFPSSEFAQWRAMSGGALDQCSPQAY